MTASDLSESSQVPPSRETKIQNQPVTNLSQPGQWWPGLLVAGVALLLFALTRFGNFQAEDFTLLGQLRGNKQTIGDTLGFFFSDWGLDGKFYSPLARLLFYFEYKFFQTNAAYWHLISALLHTGTAVLVWLLVKRLLHREWVALIAGLFFAVLPVHVNVVAQIAGQADLLATLFCLAAAISFVSARQHSGAQFTTTGTGQAYWLAVIFYGLALLCRQEAVALPLALLAYDFVTGGLDRILHQETEIEEETDQKAASSHLLGYYLPFLGLVVVYLLLNFGVLGGLSAYLPPANAQVSSTPANTRPFTGSASAVAPRNDLGISLRGNLRMLTQPFSLGGTDGLILLAALAAFLALTGVQEWEAWLINNPLALKTRPVRTTNHAAHSAEDDDELTDLPVNPLDTIQNGTAPPEPALLETPVEHRGQAQDQPANFYPTDEVIEDAGTQIVPAIESPAILPVVVAPGAIADETPLPVLIARPAYWTLRIIAFGFMWTAAFILPFILGLPTDRTIYVASVGFAIFLAAALTPFGMGIVDKAVDRSQARALFGPFELSFILRVVAIAAVFVVYFATSVQAIDEWNKTTKAFTAVFLNALGLV